MTHVPGGSKRKILVSCEGVRLSGDRGAGVGQDGSWNKDMIRKDRI